MNKKYLKGYKNDHYIGLNLRCLQIAVVQHLSSIEEHRNTFMTLCDEWGKKKIL